MVRHIPFVTMVLAAFTTFAVVLTIPGLSGRIAHAEPQPATLSLQQHAGHRADIDFWREIDNSGNFNDFRQYLEHFPNGLFAENAYRAMEVIRAENDFRCPDAGDETPFYRAARANSVKIMQLLKTHGLDMASRDKNGQTPMHIAACANAVEAMAWLKAQGANTDARDSLGQTPLDRARAVNARDAIEWLKMHGGESI